MTGERILLIAIAYGVLTVGSRLIIFRALSRGALSRSRAALAAAAVSTGLLFVSVVVVGIYDALGPIWFVLGAIHFVMIYGWIELLTAPAAG